MRCRLLPGFLLSLLAAGGALAPAPSTAQTAPPTPAHGAPAAEPPPLFVRRDAWFAGGALLATLLASPLDEPLAEALRSPGPQRSPVLQHGADAFRVLGFPGSVAITGGLYLAGRLRGRSALADVGLHATEAIVLGEVAAGVVKVAVGRARPYRSPGDPRSFRLGRGLRGDDFQAFPSGHTVAAFAAAGAVSRELQLRRAPAWRPVSLVLYGGATLVGASRMYEDLHWASDVVAGAALGVFSGWKVVGWSHAHPGNRLHRLLLPAAVAPAGEGAVAVVWVVPLAN